MADRATDWLSQAEQDLQLASLSAGHGHHEWACFAAHQAVGKALKGLQLSLGQQVWGQGLGRLFRALPDALQARMEASVPELVDRLRVLDAPFHPDARPGKPSRWSPLRPFWPPAEP